ncbi:MAG: 2Fe-2S iron-sulfur cluster binding domain-containing protein [Spirochaetales bacterium]
MFIPVFLAASAVGAITAILSLLISITDKIVNNYGEVSIDINNGKKQIKIKGGAPLLFSLAEIGIYVPSACGGRGSCGACKVQVKSDVGPYLPTELPYLTKEEIDTSTRLSCQIKLKKDIAIQIPEALFNIKRYKGTVERIRDVTHDIKEVYIRLDEPQEIDFLAGQYVQLMVPPYEKIKEPTERAYSMSSRPSDRNHVELLIRLVPGGIVTTYVHTRMKEGEQVTVTGPFGEFHVRETGATMLCVAGGSGMAPFKAIFYDMIEKKKMDREIWYFFGARTKKDLFYLEELEKIAAEWSNFHFIAALSEPQPEDNWEGETGLITEVLAKYLTSQIDRTKPMEGYLCGSPGMLDACIAVMKKFEVPPEKIYFDKFA